MPPPIEELFNRLAPSSVPTGGFASLRWVDERMEALSVRRGVVQPFAAGSNAGVMVTVSAKGGMGYAATSDASESGLKDAFQQASNLANQCRAHGLIQDTPPSPKSVGTYRSPVETPWNAMPRGERVDLLRDSAERLQVDQRIVDWAASLQQTNYSTLYLDTAGSRVEQEFSYVVPSLSATANEGAETQTRTAGGRGICRQGGVEVLDHIGFRDLPALIAEEALQLIAAPNCPSKTMDVVLAPDQMILQIHESIGHPLELDRILGDERNYAGTSFVTLDMFGSYQYGSELLNVTFDPSLPEEFASYAFDDEGQPAQREYIIRDGILQRPLGGSLSQLRAGVDGVSCARACSWNRPPIDRMANLNLESGTTSFDDMIADVERGVLMKSNCSWSIDDSRNKFQFGCEWAQLIENGRLTTVVKNPNYRGISATFWRSLTAVGAPDTADSLGSPNCGKGEPNQVIRVGHASPTCRFSGVDVFGGA